MRLPEIILLLLFFVGAEHAAAQRTIITEPCMMKDGILSGIPNSGREIQRFNSNGQLLELLRCHNDSRRHFADTDRHVIYTYSMRGLLETETEVNHFASRGTTDTFIRKYYICRADSLVDTMYTYSLDKYLTMDAIRILRRFSWDHYEYDDQRRILRRYQGESGKKSVITWVYRYTSDTSGLTVKEYRVKRHRKKLTQLTKYNNKGLVEIIRDRDNSYRYEYEYDATGEWVVQRKYHLLSNSGLLNSWQFDCKYCRRWEK
ncbi:hypothetical protein ACTHGU_02755 [Chitinophagaceae bacterium MMS25-I14]